MGVVQLIEVAEREDTRSRVARTLLHDGPATAATLSVRLGLTPAGLRRHLLALTAEGLVESSSRPPFGPVSVRGRGRPAQVFHLTDQGRQTFHQGYDALAIDALEFLANTADPLAVQHFAEQRLLPREREYTAALNTRLADRDDNPTQRAQVLAELLTGDGYAAGMTTTAAGGGQLCQHNCPVSHAAVRFPQLCEAETAMFSRLLGTHVQRLATIARGDALCTTHVPALLASSTATASSITSLINDPSHERDDRQFQTKGPR